MSKGHRAHNHSHRPKAVGSKRPRHPYSSAVSHIVGQLLNYGAQEGLKYIFNKPHKGPGSRTTTKEKESKVRETIQHNELVKAGDRVIVHKFAPCKPSEGRWRYVDQVTGQISSVEGMQGVDDIGYYFLWSQFLSSTVTPVRTLKKTALGNGFFLMNPFQKSTGGDATNNSAKTLSDDRITLEKIDCKYSFMNASLVNTTVDIWAVSPKAGAYYGPTNEWNRCLQAETLGTNSAAVQKTTLSGPTAGFASSTLVGQMPFENANFAKQFKLLKHKRITMSPGENVDWHLSLHYNMTIDRTYAQNQQQGSGSDIIGTIAGKSVFLMMRTQGALVKDIVDGSFTYGSTTIGIVSTNEYFLKMGRPLADRTQINYVVPSLTSGSSVSNQQIILDTDVVAPSSIF